MLVLLSPALLDNTSNVEHGAARAWDTEVRWLQSAMSAGYVLDAATEQKRERKEVRDILYV